MTADERIELADPELKILLHASIVAGPQHHYAVTLKPGNGSAISEHDYLRFALHYYARVLYELVHTGHSVRDLPASVDRIAAGAGEWHGDLFAVAGVRGSLSVAIADPIGEVVLQFRRAGFRDFDLIGDVPFAGLTLGYSVLAVFQAIASRLSPEVVHALRTALANMNASYVITHRYSDPLSCREVPAIAYLAAAFV